MINPSFLPAEDDDTRRSSPDLRWSGGAEHCSGGPGWGRGPGYWGPGPQQKEEEVGKLGSI